MSGNLPGHEAKKPTMGPLKRMENAIRKGHMGAFDRALADCVASTNQGNWQHRALGLVMDAPSPDAGMEFMVKLMGCPKPPIPSAQENFIGMAVLQRHKTWAIEPLIKSGFKIKPAQVDGDNPIKRMAYLVVMGEADSCRGLLPGVLGREGFLEYMGEFITRLWPDPVFGFFFSPSSAMMLEEVFMALPETRKDRVADRVSYALGNGMRINGRGTDENTLPWRDGYHSLRRAGMLDLHRIMEGIGQGQTDPSNKARELFRALEAWSAAKMLQGGTARVEAGTRVARF